MTAIAPRSQTVAFVSIYPLDDPLETHARVQRRGDGLFRTQVRELSLASRQSHSQSLLQSRLCRGQLVLQVCDLRAEVPDLRVFSSRGGRPGDGTGDLDLGSLGFLAHDLQDLGLGLGDLVPVVCLGIPVLLLSGLELVLLSLQTLSLLLELNDLFFEEFAVLPEILLLQDELMLLAFEVILQDRQFCGLPRQ